MTDEGAEGPANEPELRMEMIRAGMDAYKRWNSDDEEIAALVVDVFYSMLRAIPDHLGRLTSL
ncbi:hypothetical protein [Mesorhizobium amorphae]|uniref:hypothetical protein n=1 Tax=Mesorhizobium amorphae TaxID=71433 RepID=UPI001AEDFEEF|nr:hypothetical protein [Mesorhizobium amorphae]